MSMIGSNAKKSLLNKEINCSFGLEEDSLGYLHLINREELFNKDYVFHSLKINPSEKKMEVSFLKHKRKRKCTEDNENLSVTSLPLHSSKPSQESNGGLNGNSRIKRLTEIIQERKAFYSSPQVMKYLNLNNYEKLISRIDSHSSYNEHNSFQSFFGSNKPLSSIDISPNQLPTDPQLLHLRPNSLFNNLFETVESKFNKGIDFIFLTGEKGMGKTSALMLYAYMLRLNPFNLVISIFNYELFLQQPFDYLFNEILFGITPLYIYNSDLSISTLFSLYYDLLDIQQNNKHSDQLELFHYMCSVVFNQIYNVLKAYLGEISLYFIIDDYEKYSKEGLAYVSILKGKIDLLKLNPLGIVDTQFEHQSKRLFCGTNDNRAIISHIEELNQMAVSFESILTDFIVYIQPQKMFKCEELYDHFKLQFNLIEEHKPGIIQLIKAANYNYALIDQLLRNDNSQGYLLEENVKEKIRAIYLDDFNKKFDLMTNEERLDSIYQIFSYDKLDQLSEDYVHSFKTTNYLHYNYSIVIPYLNHLKEGINFKFVNCIWQNFCASFEYDYYYCRIDFAPFDLKYFGSKYNLTKSKILKGILLEEMAFLFFFNKAKMSSFTQVIPILIYAKELSPSTFPQRMNPLSRFEGNSLKLLISKAEKSETFENDVLTVEKIPLLQSGIYFLSHRFPLIDAIVVDNSTLNILLVQMKKRLKQEHIIQTMKDFNLLFLMLENDSVFKEIGCYISQYNKDNKLKHNTKISVINTLAQLANSKGYSFNFLFTYIHKDPQISMTDSFTQVNEQFQPEIDLMLKDHQWSSCSHLLGVYEFIKETHKLVLYKRRAMRNIAMCSLDEFVKGLDSDKASWFTNLTN